MLTEADRLSDLHNTMRDNLINGVHMKAKQWQKETYSKQKLGGLKQHKELDEGFSKVVSLYLSQQTARCLHLVSSSIFNARGHVHDLITIPSLI